MGNDDQTLPDPVFDETMYHRPGEGVAGQYRFKGLDDPAVPYERFHVESSFGGRWEVSDQPGAGNLRKYTHPDLHQSVQVKDHEVLINSLEISPTFLDELKANFSGQTYVMNIEEIFLRAGEKPSPIPFNQLHRGKTYLDWD